jgi:UDP-N-acetylglucosamine--N-acetylmuramyl-(pentapeptide) pyrophosphoryl-undecaprenol N-acetylglucosamine transferase
VKLRPLKFIISGGGTGGHIFPAIAIANALKARLPDAEFLFVGAEGRMEMEKVPAAGYKIEGLWISGLQRRLTLSNLAFPFKVISSLLKAKRILKDFKPDAVIGTGGYASGPMLRVAANAGVVTLIQEQNSYPGITNKLLASKVDRVCVAYENMDRFFPKQKIVMTGNPVRQDILNLDGKKARALEQFNLNSDKLTILVIGGSLGARSINQAVSGILKVLSDSNVQLIWQTGNAYHPKAVEDLKASGVSNFFVAPFISRMDLAYSAADIVVSRAGASSISELCITGKASILVPSPNVAEDHQTKNALALVQKGAAMLIKDQEVGSGLAAALKKLIESEEVRVELSLKISMLAMPNSADLIAGEVLNLLNKRNV